MVIGNDTRYIDSNFVNHCVRLNNLIIMEGVENIELFAFYGINVHDLVIPKSLKNFREMSFNILDDDINIVLDHESKIIYGADKYSNASYLHNERYHYMIKNQLEMKEDKVIESCKEDSENDTEYSIADIEQLQKKKVGFLKKILHKR